MVSVYAGEVNYIGYPMCGRIIMGLEISNSAVTVETGNFSSRIDAERTAAVLASASVVIVSHAKRS
jgi:hypothetical protein